MDLFIVAKEKHTLIHPYNDLLNRELIFSFINEYKNSLGIDVADDYNLDDLNYAFQEYIYIWLDTVIDYLIENSIDDIHSEEDCLAKENFHKSSYFDPRFLDMKIIEKLEIKELIDKKIGEKHIHKNRIIGSVYYPVEFIYSTLDYYNKLNITTINAPYIKYDYQRCSENNNYIYNLLSKENLLVNIKAVFAELPKLYDEFVSLNFPMIQEEISFFNNFNLAVITMQLKEVYTDIESPEIFICYFKSDKKCDNKMLFFEDKSFYERYSRLGELDFTHENIIYTIVATQSIDSRNYFSKYPLLYHSI